MAAELDHVFICTARGGNAEADRLVTLGLTEGGPNVHPGQGTACRRFFFRNAYLELLWVDKPDEAQSESVRPMRLWERWSGRAEQLAHSDWAFVPKQTKPRARRSQPGPIGQPIRPNRKVFR